MVTQTNLQNRSATQFDPSNSVLPGVISVCQAMQEVARVTRQVAPSRACVLLLGETGTGKELIAKALHDLGPRRSGPYIRVNCGALTESLLESELFGHVKGSFTGATDNRTGRFEAAHTGSLFLDEINSTSPKLQVKLLRVLQEGEFERVGDFRSVRVDTRVIAATNRDLREEVASERFREDLYYRLNVVPIILPPLRERREDIPMLLDYFLRRYAAQNLCDAPVVHPEAAQILTDYHWPGNVRELQNYAERAVILGVGKELTVDDLPPEVRGEKATNWLPRWTTVGTTLPTARSPSIMPDSTPQRTPPAQAVFTQADQPGQPRPFESMASDLVSQGVSMCGPNASDLHEKVVGQVENELIRHVMKLCDNIQIKAAARLGINRNTLHKKIQEMKLDQADSSENEIESISES
ncbi:MAG: sigma-54 interaction domain-containing protein [bacterium]